MNWLLPEYSLIDAYWNKGVGRVTLTFINPNKLAGVIVMTDNEIGVGTNDMDDYVELCQGLVGDITSMDPLIVYILRNGRLDRLAGTLSVGLQQMTFNKLFPKEQDLLMSKMDLLCSNPEAIGTFGVVGLQLVKDRVTH